MTKREYQDCAEFTEDMYLLKELTTKLVEVLNKPEFADWMIQTDNHFDTDCRTYHRSLKRDASALDSAVDGFIEHIHDAET